MCRKPGHQARLHCFQGLAPLMNLPADEDTCGPTPGFRATEDHRPGSSHVFYSKRQPSFGAFVAGVPGAGFVPVEDSDVPMLASKPAVASVMPRA